MAATLSFNKINHLTFCLLERRTNLVSPRFISAAYLVEKESFWTTFWTFPHSLCTQNEASLKRRDFHRSIPIWASPENSQQPSIRRRKAKVFASLLICSNILSLSLPVEMADKPGQVLPPPPPHTAGAPTDLFRKKVQRSLFLAEVTLGNYHVAVLFAHVYTW